MNILKQVLALIVRNKILTSLLIILTAAFFIRIIGIDYGLPHQLVSDEFLMVAVSLKMLDSLSLSPNFPEIFYHQPLTAYISVFGISAYLVWQLLSGRFLDISAMKEFYVLNAANLLIVVRFLSVLFGVGTVLFLYLIGRDLFNRRAGILAAFFGAFEFLSVQVHHTGGVWGFLEFFIALALWASVKVLNRGDLKSYIKSALASVAAVATLLPGIFTFVPTMAAKFSLKNKKLYLAAFILLLGVILSLYLSPRGLGVLLLRFGLVKSSLLNQLIFSSSSNLSLHISPDSISQRFFDTFITVFNYIPVYFVLMFLGLWILWKNNRRKFVFLAPFLVVYYLFVGPFFAYGRVARAMLPFTVYAIVISAFAVDYFLNKKIFANRKVISILFVTLIGLYSITLSVLYDLKIVRADTRVRAVDWVYHNLPEDSKIMVFSTPNGLINQNKQVLEEIRNLVPEYLDTKQKVLLTADDSVFPRPKYFVWDLNRISASSLPSDFFKKEDFKYYLRTRWGTEAENYFDNIIEKQFSDKKPIVNFKPFTGKNNFKGNFMNNIINPLRVLFTVERFGPIIEIYEVKFK